MKISKLFLLLGLVATTAACDENKTATDPVGPADGDFSNVPVRVTPLITRATETDFEVSDAIGLTITRASGVYVTNAKLTYADGAFSGNLKWYSEGGDKATLAAYYPYQNEVPTSFTVATDQSTPAALSASDFLSSVKEEVLPSSIAIAMAFRHQLSRIVITVVNNSDAEIAGITLKGVQATAAIAGDLTVAEGPSAAPVNVKTCLVGDKYLAILPPQTVTMTAAVEYGGSVREQKLAEATLLSGKQYSVSIIVNASDIKVVLSGDIENWQDGGEIGGGESGDADGEHLSEGYITYGGENYAVVKMKDGKWWMAQNLRYVPEGLTPSSDLTAVTAGVFNPLRVNDAKTALEFTSDPETIVSNGYLYQAEVALGLKVGDLTSVAAAEQLEGVRGICPEGWHVPTIADITGLVGKAVSPITTNGDAPYYDGNNGSIALLNADGFQMKAFGAVTIQDNTKTSGSLMGYMKDYPERIASGMLCGSTYAGVTYNTSNDETSGVKNLQFYGLMPMTNKANEADYTCNGTKVSYRIAGPVRCVRDAE